MSFRLMVVTVTAAAMTVAAGSAFAAPTMWVLGFKGGLNISKVRGDDAKDLFTFDEPGFSVSGGIEDSRTGFAGGGFVMLRVNEFFAVQAEALYTQKGGKGNVSGTIDLGGGPVDFTGEARIRASYFEIPLLAVVTLPAGAMNVLLMAGPAFAFNTTADLELELNALGASESDTQDISDGIKSSDVGGVVGAGVVIPAGAVVDILLEGRWTFGFSSVDDGLDVVDLDLKNSAFSFMAGLAFPIGAK